MAAHSHAAMMSKPKLSPATRGGFLVVVAVASLAFVHLLVSVHRQPISSDFAFQRKRTDGSLKVEQKSTRDIVRNREIKKPLFILHVGPPKTSTTTLQSLVSSMHRTLEKDNFLYIGRVYNNQGHFSGYFNKVYRNIVKYSCVEGGELNAIYEEEYEGKGRTNWTQDARAPSCWKEFLRELARVRKTGMNVIISDEMLCIRGHNSPGDFHYGLLKDSLQDWDVRILATYRRFFAWLPSHKNHLDKYRLNISEKKRFTSWTGTPSKPMFKQLKECMDDPSNIRYPYLDWIVSNYSKYFPVEIMNMHDKEYKTMASQFVCKFLPNAKQTCRLSKILDQRNNTSSLKLNTAKSNFYDILGMEAYRRGIIPGGTGSRREVREQIESRHKETLGLGPYDFPLKCPSRKEVSELLDISLGFEERFFPDFHRSELGEKAHRKEFWEMYDNKRFCSIDTTKTLRQRAWLDFFAGLKRKSSKQDDYDAEEEDDESSGDDESDSRRS